jgi:hypothetical protein
MSDLELFALTGIITALAAAVLVPQASRVAPLSVINFFATVLGVLATSIGFLAFTTDWYEPGAWRSGILIVLGSLIACYMMNRCIKHNHPLG